MRKIFYFSVFFLLAIFVTWPLILHLDHFVIDPYDSLLITWIQNWWLHSISLQGNIFYPYPATLAFSDYQLVSTILGAPFVFLSGEPLVGFNVNLILGFALTGIVTFYLAKHFTKSDPASFLAGVLVSFSTIHLNHMGHPQIFHMWLVILPVLLLFQKRFKLFSLFFALAVINSPLNLYFFLFFVTIFILVIRQDIKKTLLAALISSFISGIFLLPYFWVSHHYDYVRPITDAINFSLQLPDLLNVSIHSRLSRFFPQGWGTPAYFGAVFLCLIGGFAIAFWRQPKKDKIMKFWLWSAGLAFILALGPALHIFRHTVHVGPIPVIPLPYAILYYIIPGFSGFRTPSRWILITVISLAIAITLYFSKRITWFWAVVLSALVIMEINLPFRYFSVPRVREFPPEQVWLKNNYVGAPIIQFPIYGWFDGDKVGVETMREYYSTIHWHPMFNGHSGFSPREWEERVRWLQKNFPSRETIDWIKEEGIKLVLVPKSWENKVAEFSEVKLVQSFPTSSVFEVR